MWGKGGGLKVLRKCPQIVAPTRYLFKIMNEEFKIGTDNFNWYSNYDKIKRDWFE